MKYYQTKLSAIILLLTLTVIGCKKVKVQERIPEESSYKLTLSNDFQNDGAVKVTQYLYSGDGVLIAQHVKKGNSPIQHHYLEYLNSVPHARIVREEDKRILYEAYEFQNNRLHKSILYRPLSDGTQDKISECSFYYENGRLKKISSINRGGGSSSTREFYYSGNNIVQVNEYDSMGSIVAITDYQYDSMPNPYKENFFEHLDVRCYNANNIVKVVRTTNGRPEPGEVKEFSYRYNQKGYPAEKYYNTVGENILHSSFKYFTIQ